MGRTLLGALLLLVSCLAAPAWAKWADILFDDVVLRSDAVLIGTLSSVVEFTEEGIDFGSGRIAVEKVVFGDLSPDSELQLQWQNESDIICPRVEHQGHAGVRGLWLVKLRPRGTARADYPGRFLSLSDPKAIRQAMVELREALHRNEDRRLRTVFEELSAFATP